jgi:hypothetical protein
MQEGDNADERPPGRSDGGEGFNMGRNTRRHEITGIVFGIRWLVHQGSAESKGDCVLDVLRVGYARGEINREFLARKRDL